jgi:hypothetical protein
MMRSTILLFLALAVSAFGQAFPGSAPYQAAFLKSTAAGGSPAWYDSVASGSTDANQAVSDPGFNFAAVVTVGQTGNATKLRVYIQNADFDPAIKVALYSASSNLLANASSTLSDGSVPYSKEITISSTAVTSGTPYLVTVQCQSNGSQVQFRYLTSSGVTFIDEVLYASSPADPYVESFKTGAGAISVGIYVEP